jgi:hypothetical protein
MTTLMARAIGESFASQACNRGLLTGSEIATITIRYVFKTSCGTSGFLNVGKSTGRRGRD